MENQGRKIIVDGYTLEVFSSLYVDWGLRISKDGEDVFYNPCCLSNESYGFHNENDEGVEYEGERPEWTDKEWRECLESEADTFLEAYTEEMQ